MMRPPSPIDKFFSAAERRRETLVMRQIVHDRQNCMSALNVELRLELAFGQKVSADASRASLPNFRKEMRATGSATHP
jgi:ribose 1,5-bisphosphokinase PhnN